MSTLASDDFNRADSGDLGTSWDVMTSETAWKVQGNAALPSNVNADCSETYNAVTFPADQWAQANVTENITVSTTGCGVLLRGATGARTYYRFIASQATSGNIEIAKQVAGSYTSLATRTTTFVNGDVLYAEAQGTTLLVKLNGTQLGSTVTDSSIASGRAGISSSGISSGSIIDNWSAGDFDVVLPPKNIHLQAVRRAAFY